MRKSILLRRIVLLLLSAVLLSGLLSFGIYVYVTQRLYVNMRAEELTPIARTVAEMVADAQQSGYGIWPLLNRDNRGFGASLHVYDANGDSVMNPPDSDRQPPDAPFALSEEEALSLIAGDLETVLSGVSISETRKSADGDSYLVVGVPIQNGGITGAVFFTQAMRELSSAMYGLNLTLLVSTAAAFLIMLIPAYFATKHLVIPIRQMRSVARAMAKGDFSVRADDTQKGEIGELGRAMNHFAAESAQLEQTRRDYVANVSHELRTPIASIRAMGETLRDGMAKTAEKKELFYHNIVRESLRLSRLVDDLLELSRLQAGTEAMRKTSFDLRETLRNVSELYGYSATDARVTFTLAADMAGPIPVYSNPDRVEQVLIILLDNADKHTPAGGAVTLAAARQNGKVELRVENTGETIAQEDLPFLFERFYKADKSHSGGGTGLGLSIAREIVKGLGESIYAQSADGVTSFVFTVSL